MVAPDPQISLVRDIKRLAIIDHILAAARRLVLSVGLEVTMDQLADASGVSRRTLFRHFATREKLLAAAFDAGMASYHDQLPAYNGEPDGWLRDICEATHRMNSTIGPGFFELAARPDLADDLLAVEQRRRAHFRAHVSDIAATLWTAHNAKGRVPVALTNAVAGHLSPFFTAAMSIDADKDWRAAAKSAYNSIRSVLDDLVQAPR